MTYKLFPALIRTKAESQEKIKYLLKYLNFLNHQNYTLLLSNYIF